jgi:hypothetical protein
MVRLKRQGWYMAGWPEKDHVLAVHRLGRCSQKERAAEVFIQRNDFHTILLYVGVQYVVGVIPSFATVFLTGWATPPLKPLHFPSGV